MFAKIFIEDDKLEQFLQNHSKFSVSCLQFVRCTFLKPQRLLSAEPTYPMDIDRLENDESNANNDNNNEHDLDMDLDIDMQDNYNDNNNNNLQLHDLDMDLDIDMQFNYDDNISDSPHLDINMNDMYASDNNNNNNNNNRDSPHLDINMNEMYESDDNNNNNNNNAKPKQWSALQISTKEWLSNHTTKEQLSQSLSQMDRSSKCIHCYKHESRSNLLKILPNRFIPPPTIIYYNEKKMKLQRADPSSFNLFQMSKFVRFNQLLNNPLRFDMKTSYDIFNPLLSLDDIQTTTCDGTCGQNHYRVTKALLERHQKNFHWQSKVNKLKQIKHMSERLSEKNNADHGSKKYIMNHWKNDYLIINHHYEYEWVSLPDNDESVLEYKETIKNIPVAETDDEHFWPHITEMNQMRFWTSGWLSKDVIEQLKQYQFMSPEWIALVDNNQEKQNKVINQERVERKIKYKSKKPHWCFCHKHLDETQYQMISCNLCGGFWHPECLNKSYEELKEHVVWLCPYCDLHKSFGNYDSKLELKRNIPMSQKQKDTQIKKKEQKIKQLQKQIQKLKKHPTYLNNSLKKKNKQKNQKHKKTKKNKTNKKNKKKKKKNQNARET